MFTRRIKKRGIDRGGDDPCNNDFTFRKKENCLYYPIKGGEREREGRVGLQGALCSSLFFPSLSPVWLQPSLFSSRTRALFINVKHLHARVPHCTIYAFRLWERERAAEAICRGLLSVCRLGPSSHLVTEKRKNNNLTSIPFETPILRVQFLIVRREDKISRRDRSLFLERRSSFSSRGHSGWTYTL